MAELNDFFFFLFHHYVARGAITGFVAAAATDLHAFKMWKSVDEAKAYQWGVAAWRWFQGAVLGALTAAGLGAL